MLSKNDEIYVADKRKHLAMLQANLDTLLFWSNLQCRKLLCTDFWIRTLSGANTSRFVGRQYFVNAWCCRTVCFVSQVSLIINYRVLKNKLDFFPPFFVIKPNRKIFFVRTATIFLRVVTR
jgi:hypothetical protein